MCIKVSAARPTDLRTGTALPAMAYLHCVRQCESGALARVMIGRPRLVLIDEPSEGLVPMIVVDIFAIITEMKQTGAIVLPVEQNVHGALAVAMGIKRRFANARSNSRLQTKRVRWTWRRSSL